MSDLASARASRRDSPLRDRVIFVVGARRSGTTWLERILTAHPDVVGMNTETHLFSHAIRPLAERFQHANPNAPGLARAYIPRGAFLDGVRGLVDLTLLAAIEHRRADARYVVERTPGHASHLPLIADVYPDARVINIIRDGRDVARSLVSMPWGPPTMAAAAAEWRDAVQDARAGAALLGERYREVIYEDVLADPRGQISALLEWLGLELDDETWQRILAEAGTELNVDAASPGVRAGKWRHELTAAEVAEFERVAGAQLDALGYERAAPRGAPARRRARWDRLRGALPTRARIRDAVRRRRDPYRPAAEQVDIRRLHMYRVSASETVAQFEWAFSAGDRAAARALLDRRLWVRIDEAGALRESRGEAAADDLLAVLDRQRSREGRVLSGQVHATPFGVTTIATSEAGDGTRWLRALVYEVHQSRLTEVSLYLHPLTRE